MLVALAALFIALGGTSYAAAELSGSRAPTAVRARLRHTSTGDTSTDKALIKELARGLSVASAKTAARASTAKIAANSLHATTAGSAQAIAFAHVKPTGRLDRTHSRNVSSSTRIETGIYCVRVTIPVSNMVAMPDVDTTGKPVAASGVLGGQDPAKYIQRFCPAADDAIVIIGDPGGATVNDGFWVTFN